MSYLENMRRPSDVHSTPSDREGPQGDTATYRRADVCRTGYREGRRASMLADAFEREHFPIAPADAIDAILFRMEQQGLQRKDLEPFIGSRHRVCEVLNRKRGLSLEMIRRLNRSLGIPLNILIGSSTNTVRASRTVASYIQSRRRWSAAISRAYCTTSLRYLRSAQTSVPVSFRGFA